MTSQKGNSTSLAWYTRNSHLTPATIFQAHIMFHYPTPHARFRQEFLMWNRGCLLPSWIKMTITSHSQEKQKSTKPLRKKFQRIPLSTSRLKNKWAFPTKCWLTNKNSMMSENHVCMCTTMFVDMDIVWGKSPFSIVNSQFGSMHHCFQFLIPPCLLAFRRVALQLPAPDPMEDESTSPWHWCWEWSHSMFWPMVWKWHIHV